MELSFWHERWETGQIGFHQSDYNPYMLKYWGEMQVPLGSKVFVPMAGKSNDMFWLAEQGYKVMGVELSSIAVKAFFEENELEYEIRNESDFDVYYADNIEIYCGDFFKLTPLMMAGAEAVFDRASLIALPPHLRKKYVDKMRDILPVGCKSLLISMQYQQEQMEGPPFSVHEDEVFELYEDGFNVSRQECIDVLGENDRFAQRGLTGLHECIYKIKRL
ncbi:MAG: thiopurine S-methyltransferase [Gammaproteobacteria bacterium]|nr:thiopurine S-methyltransferase [Gammaproteobacteria bacterium]